MTKEDFINELKTKYHRKLFLVDMTGVADHCNSIIFTFENSQLYGIESLPFYSSPKHTYSSLESILKSVEQIYDEEVGCDTALLCIDFDAKIMSLTGY